MAAGLAAACRSNDTAVPVPAPSNRPPSPPSESAQETAASLVELGEMALENGRLRVAQNRYDRALARDPSSLEARVGLARIARQRENTERVRSLLGEVLARDGDHADALVGLASLDIAEGADERARERLFHAVRANPHRPEPHWMLADLTGPARSPPATDLDGALGRASGHPYDLRANLQAARALVAEGRQADARVLLESILWFGDSDLEGAFEAVSLLNEIAPEWRSRRIVPVHVFCDADVRRDPWWQWRLRILWLSLSRTLDFVLDTTFLPVTFTAFDSSGSDPQLSAIVEAALSVSGGQPPEGIVAVFTERTIPRDGNVWSLGEAQWLGEQMAVRLRPDETTSRSAVHEILHLYGAVHVAPEVDSLMNPQGTSLDLDQVSHWIVSLLRGRHFSRDGDVEQDILPHVDVETLANAYTQMLNSYLAIRLRGIERAESLRASSPEEAAMIGALATQIDPEMAKVANFSANLALYRGAYPEARGFFDASAILHGRDTAAGQHALERSREIRRKLRKDRRRERRQGQQEQDDRS